MERASACERSMPQTVMGARGELRTLYQGNIFPSLPPSPPCEKLRFLRF